MKLSPLSIKICKLMSLSPLLYATKAWGADIKINEVETYEVRKGDTLSGIAQKFNPGKSIYKKPDGSLHQILQLNPGITNPDRIEIGQLISIRQRRAIASEQPAKVEETVEPPIEGSLFDYVGVAANLALGMDSINFKSNSSNTTIKMSSRLNYSLGLNFKFDVTDYFRNSFFVNFKNYNFKNFNGYKVENGSPSAFAAGLKFEKIYSHKFTTNFVIEANEEVLARTLSTKKILLEKNILPTARAEGVLKFYQGSKYDLKSIAGISYTGNGSNDEFSPKGGLGFNLGVQIEKNTPLNGFTSELFYRQKEIETNFTEQENTEMGVLLFYSF